MKYQQQSFSTGANSDAYRNNWDAVFKKQGSCGPACYAMPECNTCGRNKAPRGRDVAPAAAAGYCTYDCPGYADDPQPGHAWPDEAPVND